MCVDICDGLRYVEGDQCIVCDAACKECDGNTGKCTDCHYNGAKPLLTQTGECSDKCSTGQYQHEEASTKQCVPACPVPLYHFTDSSGNKFCIETCDGSRFVESDQCVLCDSSCKTCENGDTCLSCEQASLYKYYTPDSQCVA